MQDTEYQAYLKKQSYEDLLSIRSSLNAQTYPDRYAMVISELDERDKLPPPLQTTGKALTWTSNVRPKEIRFVTKFLLAIGFVAQFGSCFMQYAEAEVIRATRPIVALVGAALFIAGCVQVSKTKGRSAWFGLLGVFNILGLGVICALEERQGSQGGANQ
jgi:hypothetical protein